MGPVRDQDGRAATRSRAAIVALAQWPAAIAVFGWSGEGSRDGRAVALALAVAGMLMAAVPRRPRAVAGWLLPAALVLAAAYVLAMQGWSFVVPLVLSGVTFLVAALGVFASGARGTSLVAVGLGASTLLVAGAEVFRGHSAQSAGSFENTMQVPDPVLTWRLIPFAEQHHTGRDAAGNVEFDVTYHIDGTGARVVPGQPETGPKWLVFGGSYVFGFGVDDDATLPARLQALRPDRRVVDLGVNGYGPGDVALYLPERLRDPEDVELCVYPMIEDHFRRAENPVSVTALEWGRAKPRFRLVDGEPRYVGPAYRTLDFPGKLNVDIYRTSSLYSALVPPWSLGPEALELTAALMREMDRSCRERGTRFVLALIPQQDPTQPRMQDLGAWIDGLRRAGVTVVDYRGRFFAEMDASGAGPDAFFLSNRHPRRSCNELLAGWLEADLR